MATTVKQVRKILGKLAADVSDEELEKDIEAATLLKDLFFDNYTEHRKGIVGNTPNVP